MRILLITAALFLSFSGPRVFAMNVGFNQAWFHNDYAHQYLDQSFDAQEVDRIFKLTALAGANSLRLWFFESHHFPMIEFKDDKIVKLKDSYIENVIHMLKISKSYGVKVYMTFFDAHSFNPLKYSQKELSLLKTIFTKEGGDHFLKTIIKPLFERVQKEGLSSQIDKIDLINEGDTVVKRLGFTKRWKGVQRFICDWRSYIHSIEGFSQTPITYSIRLHPLISLPKNLLSDKGPLLCADVIDLHSYHNKGKIHRCNWVKKYKSKTKKKLILGEFGQAFLNSRYSDNLQSNATKNFIANAQFCGFDEALAWRLSDIRPGKNSEARYSFEAYGQTRPAYTIIRDHNLE